MTSPACEVSPVVHIRAALLWEVDGEPHREDVVVSDAPSSADERHIFVIDMLGRRRRRLSPDRVAKGSVLLLPPDASDADLAALRREGFDARRTMFEVIGPDAKASEVLRALANLHPFIVIAGEGALKLRAELGGDEETGRWLQDLAVEIGHPVAINFPDHDSTKTFFIQPPSWSEERFRGWVAGHVREVEAVFGDAEIVATEEPLGKVEEVTEAQWAEAMATSREAAIKLAEAELAAANERMDRKLRRLHPELYDSDGRLLEDAYARRALEITGGKRTLTREDVLKLDRERRRPVDGAPSSDAP